MQIHIAGELVDDIIARFKMLGMFTDDTMRRLYFNTLLPYDDSHGQRVVRQMLRDNERPVTDVELDRLLMPKETSPLRPQGKFTDPTVGRKIMRRAWIDSWCERHGATESDFWAEDARLAASERRPTLKAQWDRTDRIIAERKARGLPVDESGLTSMAPVGPDPFADDHLEPTPMARPLQPRETPDERRTRQQVVEEGIRKAREAAMNPIDAFFGEEVVA